eukprot:CAMPEP_0183466370 /NCGR_PEP_ID=MMETSP0370-20130417/148928_1 /TAXON_ID=268820 /ORGANISM="Peridinium aciculiferum, Strain PAER-2" /LENGTH=265 /DNA_ID=CAMNT_0025658637 /DNA_START=107 /DNA_END=900 /DNA_ORIENTATION=-
MKDPQGSLGAVVQQNVSKAPTPLDPSVEEPAPLSASGWMPAPDDASAVAAVMDEAAELLLRYVGEVEAGHWGAAESGSDEAGRFFLKRTDMPTTTFVVVIHIPNTENVLDAIFRGSSMDALVKHISNRATPSTFMRCHDFDSNNSLLRMYCHRGCLGIQLDRMSLELHSGIVARPCVDDCGHDSSRFVSLSMGTNGAVAAQAGVEPHLAGSVGETLRVRTRRQGRRRHLHREPLDRLRRPVRRPRLVARQLRASARSLRALDAAA